MITAARQLVESEEVHRVKIVKSVKSVAQHRSRRDTGSQSGARPSDVNYKGIHPDTVGETL